MIFRSMSCKHIILPFIGLIIFVGQAVGQFGAEKENTLEFCKPELTERGRRSAFRFVFFYRLTTNQEGFVESVKLFYGKTHGLVTIDHLEKCMESWRLARQGNYVVAFSVGTTADPDFISIRSKDLKLKLIL